MSEYAMEAWAEDLDREEKYCSNCKHRGILGGWCRFHKKPVEPDESCDDHEWDF